MATNTSQGITYPTTGDFVTPLATVLGTMATTTDTAISRIALRGLASALPASGYTAGRTYYATDTGQMWLDNGTAWLPQSWTAYTPTWSAANTAPSVGNGTLVGRYRYLGNKTVMVQISIVFGSTTSGGAGAWTFSMPPGIAGTTFKEQTLDCKAYLAGPGWNFDGVTVLSPGSPTLLRPQLPVSTSATNINAVQNANSGGGGGTGVPVWAGNYSFANGSNLIIDGYVEVA